MIPGQFCGNRQTCVETAHTKGETLLKRTYLLCYPTPYMDSTSVSQTNHLPANADNLDALTLDDLLSSESAVLRRIAEEAQVEIQAAGHYSSTSGHKSSGSHSSHTSARPETPLD